MGFSVSRSTRDDVEIVSVAGEMDMGTADQAEAELKRCVEATDADVIADLSAVSFIDSTGVRTLLRTFRRLRERQRRLVLVTVDQLVLRVIILSGISGMIEIADSVDDAVVRLAAA